MKSVKKAGLLLAVLLLAELTSADGRERFEMNSDRLCYTAKDDSLRSFMRKFADIGVDTAWDPSIDLRIQADIEDETLEDALDRLLSPLGYIVTWDVIDGPVEGLLRLKSIRVFKPGQPLAVRTHRSGHGYRIDSFDGRTFVADEILIGFKPATTRRDVEILLSQIGGTITDCIETLGIYRIKFNPGTNIPALVDQLKNNGLVAGAEPNYTASAPDYRISATPSTRTRYNNIAPTGDESAHLAVLDSGLEPGALPDELIADSYDALDPDRKGADNVGHGTHMAMIASGLVDPDGIESGAAGVPLLAVRTFDADGNTSNYDLMRAIDYSLDRGSKVINLSWGSETSSEFIAASISHAQSAGAIVVAAAGNEPTGEKMYPAAYPGVVAIAASNADGTIWDKSNYGDHIFASAPGMATLPDIQSGTDGMYGGTSISSALTSGAIARYRAANPAASPEEVVDRLKASLSPPQPESGRATGGGILDSAAIKRFLGQ